jgi:hypothetical protein
MESLILPEFAEVAYNWIRTRYITTYLGGITLMGGPALQIIDGQGIFLADLFGFILALPVALFLVYWMSAVKRHIAVVTGAFIGSFLGFLIILGWVGTLIFDTVLPNATPGATFFGSLLFCSALGLSFGVISDLVIARLTASDYRRQAHVAE